MVTDDVMPYWARVPPLANSFHRPYQLCGNCIQTHYSCLRVAYSDTFRKLKKTYKHVSFRTLKCTPTVNGFTEIQLLLFFLSITRKTLNTSSSINHYSRSWIIINNYTNEIRVVLRCFSYFWPAVWYLVVTGMVVWNPEVNIVYCQSPNSSVFHFNLVCQDFPGLIQCCRRENYLTWFHCFQFAATAWLFYALHYSERIPGGAYQRCTKSEIFDSDSTPASAEYTPTPLRRLKFALQLLLELQGECYKLLAVYKRLYPVFALKRLKNRIKRNCWALQNMWPLLYIINVTCFSDLRIKVAINFLQPYTWTINSNR